MATQDTPNAVPPQAAAPAPRKAAPPAARAPQARPASKPAPAKPAALAAAPAQQQAAAQQQAPEEEHDGGVVTPRRSLFGHGFFRNSSALTVSGFVHFAAFIVMGLITMGVAENEIREIISPVSDTEELEQEELMEITLEESLEAATEVTTAVVSSAPAVGAQGVASSIAPPTMVNMTPSENAFQTANIGIGPPTIGMLSSTTLVQPAPDGALGEERAIVGDYNEAMDRITQELMWMLEKGPVLVIWVFDQSESMKDDQAEIRGRIDRVYKELGLTSKAAGGQLTTAVTSYGGNYMRHTEKPTFDISEIRGAITSVPIDPSGKEIMCEAVGRSIHDFRGDAKGRQMALILVTDESGERENNDRFLEEAIAEAKSSGCKIYTLGRQSVFGYPYAHIRWQHPQTKRWHWLRIDRGPETAFIEQLQTNGFWKRFDAFDAGFGPFEQTRMSKETGGIFFMLPTVEKDLVQFEKGRYDLEQMRSYKPDLRSKGEQFRDRDQTPLRTALWQVVNVDLNPYNPASARVIVLRQHFSLDPAEFRQQARAEQQKAVVYLDYLAKVEKFLEENKRLREQEINPRWQGNYDLIYAQVVAFQVRVYEYARYLDYFMANPKTAPLNNGPNTRLVHWDIHTRPYTFAEDPKEEYQNREKVLAYIKKANELFEIVKKNHPGTPWAARAEWEQRRGYGVDLRPDYDVIVGSGTKPTIPIPNL
ncbi:MAG: vWA domain-containing protein [Pirellulaceae bacterium]